MNNGRNEHTAGYVLWYKYPEYGIEMNSLWTPLQCGAAVTGNYRDDSLRDDTGDNISDRNAVYAENTGIYYVWRNLPSKYVFFNQYRRRWGVIKPGFDADWFFKDFRAIATPCLVPNSIKWQFCHFHKEKNYKILKDAVLSLHPECRKYWTKYIEESQVLYYSNGIGMKWSDFDDYCSFLFPILDKIYNEGMREPLMLGYMSERIYTFWLKWRIGDGKIFRVPYDRLENTLL